MRQDSFASKFALCGCVGSLVSVALLAAIVRLGDISDGTGPFSSMLSSSSSKSLSGHEEIIGNVPPKYGHRRIEVLNVEDEAAEDGGMACGDIFSNVKRQQSAPLTADVGDAYDDIYATVDRVVDDEYDLQLCRYAQICDGDFPFQLLPLILCHGIGSEYSTSHGSGLEAIIIYVLLPVILALYLLLLFRLLATTADCYFSPALESFSFELGLPPRFAGATLLALGNGSPDLGSTMNAILLWNENSANDAATAEAASNSGSSSIFGGKAKGAPWTMSIGSLIGGGMFVGTVVCGLLIQACSGIPCREAFLRDVTMYALSVCVVWYALESGNVTRRDVWTFLGMYLAYVAMIFCSDMYHRKVTLPRLAKEGRKRRVSLITLQKKGEDGADLQNKLSKLSEGLSEDEDEDGTPGTLDETTPLVESGLRSYGGSYGEISVESINGKGIADKGRGTPDNTGAHFRVDSTLSKSSSGGHISTASGGRVPRRARLTVPDRFAMLMSNYDPKSVKLDKFDVMSSDSSEGSELERVKDVMHSMRGLSGHVSMLEELRAEEGRRTGHRLSRVVATASKEARAEAAEEGPPRRSGGIRLSIASSLAGEPLAIAEEGGAVRSWSLALIVDAYEELVFQCRQFMKTSFQEEESVVEKTCLFFELPFVAIRTLTTPVPCEEHYSRPILALSIALSSYWVLYYLGHFHISATAYCFISLVVGLAVLRYAEEDKLPLLASVPISLYGFFIAASYIDTFADLLVGLLQFLGTICRIPSTILGLTVLAWGNSMGDLSANLAMARKGMPDMATTGCFAGPSFNLLVGTGLGFLRLQDDLGRTSIEPVSLTPAIRIGFVFIVANCLLIVLCGGVCFDWRLPYRYSFVLFALYLLFIVMSLETAF